jgi:MFS family permease
MDRAELGVVATAGGLVFSRVFGLSVVMPNFRGHYEAAFMVDLLWIGVAFGAYGLTFALMQWPMGALSDRWGRRSVLLVGSLLFVLGSAWAAYADGVAALIAARLVQGLGTISSVAMAMVGESVPEARRTTAMAAVGVPAGLAFFLGLMVGPAFYPQIGMRGLFLLTAMVGGVAGVPLLMLRVPAAAPAAGTKRRGLPVLALALGGFTMNYALQTVLFHLPTTQWTRLLPPLAVAMVAMGLLSRLIDRAGWTWQPLAVGISGLAVAAPLMGVLGAGPDAHLAFFAGAVLFFSLHATLSAAFPSQVSRIAGRAGGRGHGTQNTLAYLGTFVGGAMAGALARPEWAFAVLGLLALASAGLLVRGLYWGRRSPAAA